MELYIEKAFLDNFYKAYNEENLSKGQQALYTILKDYNNIDWFFNYKIANPQEYESLKAENPFFGFRSLYSFPNEIDSIKTHFFEQSNCKQTLIFTNDEETWFDAAENKGALCFSFAQYENKIETIINICQFKIDLSENFQGWSALSNLSKLPINQLVINDNYILTDKSNQKIANNLVPILKEILNKRLNIKVKLEIFTKTNEKEAQIRKNDLSNYFKEFNLDISLIQNDLTSNVNFHDRLIYTNFLIIDSASGFNLIPHKTSNSQLIVENIFDKYSYKRRNKHVEMLEAYFAKISNPAIFDTMSFKFI
jgi:hypothetical protein